MADDLDFAQTLVSLVDHTGKINSIKNALVKAFRRRNTDGTFQRGQSLSLDTLLNQNTVDEEDEDQTDTTRNSTKRRLTPAGSTTATTTTRRVPYCYDYQRGSCSRTSCRYAHICSKCWRYNHGAETCPKTSGTRPVVNRRNPDLAEPVPSQSTSLNEDAMPPNARSRRNRPAS